MHFILINIFPLCQHLNHRDARLIRGALFQHFPVSIKASIFPTGFPAADHSLCSKKIRFQYGYDVLTGSPKELARTARSIMKNMASGSNLLAGSWMVHECSPRLNSFCFIVEWVRWMPGYPINGIISGLFKSYAESLKCIPRKGFNGRHRSFWRVQLYPCNRAGVGAPSFQALSLLF